MFIFIFFASANISLQAQTKSVNSLEQAIDSALEFNPNLKTLELRTAQNALLEDAAYMVPKTEIEGSFGQMNTNLVDQAYGISQSFNPFEAKAAKNLGKETSNMSVHIEEEARNNLRLEVRNSWNEYEFLLAMQKLIEEKKSLAKEQQTFIERETKDEDSNKFETAKALLNFKRVVNEEESNQLNINIAESQLKLITGAASIQSDGFDAEEALSLMIDADDQSLNLNILSLQQEKKIAEATRDLTVAQKKPDFSLGYFIMSIEGELDIDGQAVFFDRTPQFQGVALGMSLPIFGKAYKANEKISDKEVEIMESIISEASLQSQQEAQKIAQLFTAAKNDYQFYKDEAMPLAKEIKDNISLQYANQEIDFSEYEEHMDFYLSTKEEYLNAILNYNENLFQVL